MQSEGGLNHRNTTVDFSLKEVCIQISIPTYRVPNLNQKLLNQISLGMGTGFFTTLLSQVLPLLNESDNGLPCAHHYDFITWKPMHLKGLIDSKHPILSIKPNRCMGFHHPPQPAKKHTAAWQVNDASCFYIANN
jgi:hypothetical protein